MLNTRILSWLMLLLLGCFVVFANSQTFTNVTSANGFSTGGGSWPSGISLVDLDNDGDLDAYQSSHSGEATFRLNNGSGVFSSGSGTIPPTELHNFYDVNEDGKLDLSCTVFDGSCRWWISASTPGNVSFAAGNPNISTRQEALADINRDGKVDWLIDGGTRINFYYGSGTGFSTTTANLFVFDDPTLRDDGMAPMPLDLDGDGDLDLIVAWGRYEYEMGRTMVFRNDGGTFTDVTTAVGLYRDSLVILGNGDYDRDGDLDLIGLEAKRFPHSIFLNDGAGHFTKKTGAVTGSSGSPLYPGWGLASYTDFDNDGIGDIIVGGRQYTHMLRGTGNASFELKNSAWSISTSGDGNLDNTYAFGDIDADGDLDIAVHPSSRVSILYRNDLPAKNWLNLRPVALAGNKGAAGAKIRINEPGTSNLLWFEQVILQSKQAQQNYYGFSQTERHYGLGTRSSCDVTVEFYPSGKIVCRNGVNANTTATINESDAACPTGLEEAEAAGEMQLEANPNPFNPATTIKYSISDIRISGHPDVRLSVYDTRGTLVATLVDAQQSAGDYNVTWDSRHRSSGVYIIRLQISSRILTKSIFLAK